MKILFVVSELGYIDPVGIGFLSAIAKRDGHETPKGTLLKVRNVGWNCFILRKKLDR